MQTKDAFVDDNDFDPEEAMEAAVNKRKSQNLFPPGKQSRTITLNSHYMIVFKNPRDSLGISTLARQMYPNNTKYLLQSFPDATKNHTATCYWTCINLHLKI